MSVMSTAPSSVRSTRPTSAREGLCRPSTRINCCNQPRTMNCSNFWSLLPARGCRHVLGCAFILLAAIAAAPNTFAEQSAMAAPPPEVDPPVLTTAIEEPLPKPVDDVALNGPPPVESYALPPAPSEGGKGVYGAGAGITSTPKRFQWGVRLTIRGVYDDNILLSHFDRISDWYVAIEPAITIGFGDIVGRHDNYIRLDYAPSIFVYIDHSVNDFNTLISSDEIYGNLFFNYKYSPKLAFGIGAGGGFNTVDIGPDSTFEQGLFRVQYQLTGKISLNATAGVEVRQFDDNDGFGSRGDRVSGVYEIGAVYQPFNG